MIYLMAFGQKLIAYVLIPFLLFGVLLCAALSMPMHMEGMTAPHQMPSLCPMTGNTVPCQNALDHLTHWQNLFTAIPAFVSFIIVLIVVLTILPWLSQKSLILKQRLRLAPLYIRQALLPPTPLQQAFSNGILHSKAF